MKSKDIIKLLMQEDPSGETHVRFNGSEELIGFTRKEGYYDGSYTYRNKEGKLVITDKDEKLDADFESIKDRIWECKGDIEKIKKEIIIDFSNKKQCKEFMKNVIELEAEKAHEFHEKSLAEFTFYVLKKIKDGWKIIQSCKTKIGDYNQMWFEKDNKKEKMRQGDCEVVLKSGFFKVKTIDDNFFWFFSLDDRRDHGN